MSKLSQAEASALGIEPRFRYERLINQIVAAQGAFVQVRPDDLNGDQKTIKQSTLLQAARKRGLRITTTTRASGTIYARLVLDQAAPGGNQ